MKCVSRRRSGVFASSSIAAKHWKAACRRRPADHVAKPVWAAAPVTAGDEGLAPCADRATVARTLLTTGRGFLNLDAHHTAERRVFAALRHLVPVVRVEPLPFTDAMPDTGYRATGNRRRADEPAQMIRDYRASEIVQTRQGGDEFGGSRSGRVTAEIAGANP